MEEWIPALIAAVLGGTGLASLLSGGAQLTARTRLKHRIETLKFAKSNAALEATKRDLTRAIERDSLRLAALSIVRVHPIWIYGALLVSCLAVVGFLLALSATPDEAFAELTISTRLDQYAYTANLLGLTVLVALGFLAPLSVLSVTAGRRAGWVMSNIKKVDAEVAQHYRERRTRGADETQDPTGSDKKDFG